LFGPSLGLFCFKAPPPPEDEEEDKDPETKEPFLDSDTKKKPVKRSNNNPFLIGHFIYV
jgi:hypothetical protein